MGCCKLLWCNARHWKKAKLEGTAKFLENTKKKHIFFTLSIWLHSANTLRRWLRFFAKKPRISTKLQTSCPLILLFLPRSGCFCKIYLNFFARNSCIKISKTPISTNDLIKLPLYWCLLESKKKIFVYLRRTLKILLRVFRGLFGSWRLNDATTVHGALVHFQHNFVQKIDWFICSETQYLVIIPRLLKHLCNYCPFSKRGDSLLGTKIS